ncbi:hypothetical protein [Streptomyces roseoverticillatus]|uniref:Uncharacterized protein n=1 Tax=Streptomyces roseoverticillatus TaxID=66429 RepID=A0ABV3ILU8_9ACTN
METLTARAPAPRRTDMGTSARTGEVRSGATTAIRADDVFTDLWIAPAACPAPAPVAVCLPEGAECLPGIDVCCSGFCFKAPGEVKAHCHG